MMMNFKLFAQLVIFLILNNSAKGDQAICGLPTLPQMQGEERSATELGAICRPKLQSSEALLLCCIKNRFSNNKIFSFRPATDFTKPTGVAPVISPIAIRDVNEHLQTIEIDAQISLSWTNTFIDWSNSTQPLMKNIKKIGINATRFGLWLPHIVQSNYVGNTNNLKEIDKKAVLEVSNQPRGAQVTWRLSTTLTGSCALSGMDKFPFDLQQCHIDFVTMDPPSLVELKNPILLLDVMRLHPIWTVTGQRLALGQFDGFMHRPLIRIEFDLKRICNYWLLLIIMPSIFLAILQIVTFLLPFYRPKRSIYSAIITLTFVTIQLAVRVTIPATSFQIRFTFYILGQFAIGCFSTLFAVFMMAIYGKTGMLNKLRGVPDYLVPWQVPFRIKLLNPYLVDLAGLILVLLATLATHFMLFSYPVANA